MHIDTYEINIAAFDPEELPDEDDVIQNVKECVSGFLESSCAISVIRTYSGDESPENVDGIEEATESIEKK